MRRDRRSGLRQRARLHRPVTASATAQGAPQKAPGRLSRFSGISLVGDTRKPLGGLRNAKENHLTKLLSSTSLTPGGEDDPIKRDFRLFLVLVWKSGYIPGNPDPTDVQYDIADFLQHGPQRCVIEAFRGVGKSWITSAFVCWLLYCNPRLNIMVVSASQDRAHAFTTFTLRLIREMPILAFLIPKDNQRQSTEGFDVGPAPASQAPSVRSVGITGQMTGGRADVLVADDVEVPKNSSTQIMRDKLSEAIKEFDAILKPGGRIIYLGTPQTEQSIYNKLPERGYTMRIWPARYPTPDKIARYGDALAPMLRRRLLANPALAGRPTDPSRFDDDDLLKREASYGRSGFALQFQLDTSLSDAERYPLKLRDLIVTDLDPAKAPINLAWTNDPRCAINDVPNVGFSGDGLYRPMVLDSLWEPYEEIVMTIDPSGRGGDETGYAVVAALHGRLFVLDAGGFEGGYDEPVLEALAQKAKQFKVHRVLAEPNFGDGMFTKIFQPVLLKHHRCTVEETERSNAQKERRIIDTLEPVMNQHRLVVDRSLLERDYRSVDGKDEERAERFRLFFQMTRITREKGALYKDDRIDALALAVHYWTERMDQDAANAAEEHRRALLQRDIDTWLEDNFVVRDIGILYEQGTAPGMLRRSR